MKTTLTLRSARRSNPRSHRVFWGIAVLCAVGSWPLSHAGTALVVSHSLDAPDAIVLLASHEWERLPAAAAIARRYPRAVVLLTSPRVVSEHNCHRCAEREQWLQVEGVAPDRIRFVKRPVLNTYEEALATREYVGRGAPTRLLIVTSGYHTRRAWNTFSRVFEDTRVNLGIVAAEPAQGQPARWWATPYDRHYVIYEWAALLKYRVTYGIDG